MIDLVHDPSLPHRAPITCAICGRKLRVRDKPHLALNPEGAKRLVGPDCWAALRAGGTSEASAIAAALGWQAVEG